MARIFNCSYTVSHHLATDSHLNFCWIQADTTHPRHHCSYNSFGGNCYLNNAALAAKLFQLRSPTIHNVAILDIDYYCGNCTASIFYEDSSVLVVSIHCHPDYDYPFNSGFENQTGANAGAGTTLHIPLKPNATWQDLYKDALHSAMEKIVDFGAQALIVSLGLDTPVEDRVAIRRTGFNLTGSDYVQMGRVIGEKINNNIPIMFVQEGGYKMDAVGEAAANVVGGCAESFKKIEIEIKNANYTISIYTYIVRTISDLTL